MILDHASNATSCDAPGITKPVVYSIAPNRHFIGDLAFGLMDRFGASPESLSQVLVLLPTRRACRTLRETFLQLSDGAPLLLPRIRPIGDVDEDDLVLTTAGTLSDTGATPYGSGIFDIPSPVSDLRRQLLLARLIMKWDGGITIEQAVLLARSLGQLVDQVQTERLSFDGLKDLAPGDLSDHWQATLKFLRIVTRVWPEVLAEEGTIDPVDYRTRLLAWQCAAWEDKSPDHPVIAAGATGGIPAVVDLLTTVARLPIGEVILPGLDQILDDESWDAVGTEESHPQFGLYRLLARLGVDRSAVRDWPSAGTARTGNDDAPRAAEDRVRLVAEALRPASTTNAWARKPREPLSLANALGLNVQIISCRDPDAESRTIALLLRQALETPLKNAMLVTPDRNLGRRVAAEMGRWGITVDDSAGTPLSATPPAAFLLLLAQAAARDLEPAALLSVLKHPLCTIGQPPAMTRRQVRALERAALRGARPAPGLAGLRLRLKEARTDPYSPPHVIFDMADALVARLTSCLAPLENQSSCTLKDYVRALCATAEKLAESAEEPDDRSLWQGENGEVLAAFVDDLDKASGALEATPAADWAALLETLMLGRVVRPRYGTHPQLAILGPLEARLHHADMMILGSLNEGTWPVEPAVDPWMSRLMRRQFGLPSPERRLGLSAHDFAQAFCAPEVVITRSEKSDGAPTVASRWLQRLETLMTGWFSEEDLAAWRRKGLLYAEAAAVMDRPAAIQTCARPAPKPPVSARPKRLPVTQVEKWLRDPYTIYARYVLGLETLSEIDADPGTLDRGIILHEIFQAFITDRLGDSLPADALSKLKDLGRARFQRLAHSPGIAAIWWPRFERAAEAFVIRETTRRNSLRQSHVEVAGRMTITGPDGEFILTGQADRIDLKCDGNAEILDYKTGALPKKANVDNGFNPQLALEGLILRHGGFDGLPPVDNIVDLTYWQVSGGQIPLVVRAAGKTSAGDLIDQAEEGLKRLVQRYGRGDTAYVARPASDYALAFNDYEHLARIREWAVTEAAS